MRSLIVLFILLSVTCSSQEPTKRILFRSDSTWYAAADQLLFSSSDKGASWDTIFAKRTPTDTVFFNGSLDTATNVFISDAKTLFVFGWDGTIHNKTVLYSSADGGKTWNKAVFYIKGGFVGVKYLHKTVGSRFFLEGREGYYFVTDDYGKTWVKKHVMNYSYFFTCTDDRFIFRGNGDITYGYSIEIDCEGRVATISKDGGKTWNEMK
jgi:photosystem II stability/assembly factor-like uncharacterized protein